MKNLGAKLRIFRTSTSPYFPSDFNQREKKTLESLGLEMIPGFPCDVLITNTHTDFAKISPADLSKLKLIIHPNSGYDNYSTDLVRNVKAPMIIGNTIRAQAVAQYILSALMNHYAPVKHQTSWSSSREFKRPLLGELKISLIGHGHIGKILSTALRPLVKQLEIIDPFQNLNGNIDNSDAVILACGLNFSNHHLVNDDFLNKLSSRALLINAARGELVDTNALANFLKKNQESFAVLDVFEKEPNDFGIFKGLNNVLTTSHIAGVFNSIDQATIDFEYNVLNDFLNHNEFEKKYSAENLKNRLHAKGLI